MANKLFTGIVRSIFNGIGSGAGVAWPFFGIVFTLLGGAVGSILSLALGVTCMALFLTISGLIFYLSWKEMTDKEKSFADNFQKNKQKLLTSINQYLQGLYSIFLNQNSKLDFPDYFKERIQTELKKNEQLYNLLFQILAQLDLKEQPNSEPLN